MYPSLEFYSAKRALTYNVPVSFVSMTVNKQVEKKFKGNLQENQKLNLIHTDRYAGGLATRP